MCTPDDLYLTCPHQHRPHMSPCSRCGIAVCGREPTRSSGLRWETAQLPRVFVDLYMQ